MTFYFFYSAHIFSIIYFLSEAQFSYITAASVGLSFPFRPQNNFLCLKARN